MVSPWMRRALRLARRGYGHTSPNPMVGAVIVNPSGQIVGQGYHKKAGSDHAEIVALKQARDKAKGGTLYVTLEPCNHTGRTPPCTNAIIQAGIKTVNVAMEDPNPHVAGGGIRVLREQGIEVTVGDGKESAEALNRPFVTWSQYHRPYVVLKAAMTLDGKVATKTGDSKYFTGEASLAAVHRLRRNTDAILVGVGTVLADNPQLTYRGPGKARDPVRIVLDSQGRTPPQAALFHSGSDSPTLIFTTSRASKSWERDIFSAGGEVIQVAPDSNGRASLVEVLREVADRHLLSMVVEGGPTVHAGFIEQGLADHWISFVAPIIFGGSALTAVEGLGIEKIQEAARLVITRLSRIGRDIQIEGDFLKGEAANVYRTH